jgi:hypothetical protein
VFRGRLTAIGSWVSIISILLAILLPLDGFSQNQRKTAPAKKAAPKTAPRGSSSPSIYATPRNTTFLTVDSNAPNATIKLDGILAGSTNTKLEVDPGTLTVEVSAAGFESRKLRTAVIKDRENRIRIDLQRRIQPTPTPKPARPVVQAQPRGGQPQVQAQRRQPIARPIAPRTGAGAGQRPASQAPKSRLFAEDEDSDAGLIDTPMGYGMQAPMVQQPMPVQPQYMAPPQLPQQPYYQPQPVPMYPPQPMYPPPGYMMQQPYAYPPQGYGYPQPYAPPPQPMYPPPQQIAPAPQPYLPPVDSLPPLPDNSGAIPGPLQGPEGDSIYDVDEDIDAFELPPASKKRSPVRKVKKRKAPEKIDIYRSPTPRTSSSKGRRSSSSNSGNDSGMQVAAALAPFGVGQFYNGNYLFGTALMAGQAAALGAGIYFKLEANNKFAEAEALQRDGANYPQEELNRYLQETDAFVTSYDQYSLIAFGTFGGLWLIGTIEAFINAPSPKSSAKRRRTSIQMDEENILLGQRLNWNPLEAFGSEDEVPGLYGMMRVNHAEEQPRVSWGIGLEYTF